MAITSYTKSAHVSSVIGDVFNTALTAVASMFNKFTVAFEKHQTRSALHNLSARELEDIGISRAEISGVVESIFTNKR